MHWSSSRKVQTTHIEHPSRRIPRPAGNRVINDRAPDEHEHHARQHPAPLSHRAHGKSNRDGSKHALIDGKQQIWDLGGADGGGGQDVAEADVLEVADKLASGVREGKRVAPEEPLEGDDGRRHDREPYERECGLAAGEAGVEKAGETRELAVLSLGIPYIEIYACLEAPKSCISTRKP